MLNVKQWYSRSLRPGRIHFAAHSHHHRPDVTRDATVLSWDHGADMWDGKWDHIMGTVVPEAQKNAAELIGVERAGNIAFGANTHEFATRLLSAFDPLRSMRILTTTSEFRSWKRQLDRFRERDNVYVTEVPVHPYETFVERFISEVRSRRYDLAFFSHVFFDSGFRLGLTELDAIVGEFSAQTTIVIDGYHAFFAVPIHLGRLQERVYYMAGGYKYAQSDAGVGFLYMPPSCALRPENTGWFADFGELRRLSGVHQVHYQKDARRFAGATFDAAGLYRFNAVAKLFRESGVSVQKIARHVREMQRQFLDTITQKPTRCFGVHNLATPIERWRRGSFLTFDMKKGETAQAVEKALAERGICVDIRGPLLRIGFSVYHDARDVEGLLYVVRRIEESENINVD